jgi:CRISPR system Cascade subunit CasC
MFLQFHGLKSYSNAVLPNRGQDGFAKRAPMGDAERQRISSQCLKAALRDANQPLYVHVNGEDVSDTMTDLASSLASGMAIRSRYVFPVAVYPKLVMAFDGNETLAGEYAKEFAALFGKDKSGGEGKADKKANDAKPVDRGFVEQPLVIGEVEAEAIIKAIVTIHQGGIAPKDMREIFEKAAARKKAGQAVIEAIENISALKAHCGLDGALFGRMITGSVLSRVDACVHVAHALTVHPIKSVGDYFSVQDNRQLQFDEDATGGSHNNSVELTTGLFYQYSVGDLRQMVTNFAGYSAEQIGQVIGWLVRAAYRVECAAKLGSTAPFGNMPFFAVELGKRQPRTLMDAFEMSMKNADSKVAAERLLAYRELRVLLDGATELLRIDDPAVLERARAQNRAAIEVLAELVVVKALPALRALVGATREEVA